MKTTMEYDINNIGHKISKSKNLFFFQNPKIANLVTYSLLDRSECLTKIKRTPVKYIFALIKFSY